MKKVERDKAIKLRVEGYSLNEIRSVLGVAKSSVSIWVRDIELTEKQKQRLREKGFYREAVEKRRASRLASEKAKRDLVINAAQKSVKNISQKDLWLIGIMLYWAEGGKTQNMVRLANSDPEMIKIIMAFFRRVCEVPEPKFRAHIHIHPHLDYKNAEKYWSSISGIPLSQFYKTYRIPSKASQNKKDTLPYGTMDVYVMSAELFHKIKGWTQGVVASYLNFLIGLAFLANHPVFYIIEPV